MTAESFDVLRVDSVSAATRLLGSLFIADVDDVAIRLKIVETEAYNQADPASHSFRGKTPRTEIMFGPAGYLYVYFTYGMHYCCNVVVGEKGEGSAVLIRALEPLGNTDVLSIRRGGRKGVELTNGPAKLCQALGITKALNGHDLHLPPLRLQLQPTVAAKDIVTSSRIGIRNAKDAPWRFYIKHNPYVSVQ